MSKPEKEDRTDVFAINIHELHTEWENQPKLYGEYALKLADAREEYERAKARSDVVEANLDKDIRENPAEYGVSKVTEGAVEKAITGHSSMQQAVDKVIKTKHAVDVLYAMVSALDHRKSALEQLCYLHARDYFSKPTMSSMKQKRRNGD